MIIENPEIEFNKLVDMNYDLETFKIGTLKYLLNKSRALKTLCTHCNKNVIHMPASKLCCSKCKWTQCAECRNFYKEGPFIQNDNYYRNKCKFCAGDYIRHNETPLKQNGENYEEFSSEELEDES